MGEKVQEVEKPINLGRPWFLFLAAQVENPNDNQPPVCITFLRGASNNVIVDICRSPEVGIRSTKYPVRCTQVLAATAKAGAHSPMSEQDEQD